MNLKLLFELTITVLLDVCIERTIFTAGCMIPVLSGAAAPGHAYTLR
jgi:hypothetical protein